MFAWSRFGLIWLGAVFAAVIITGFIVTVHIFASPSAGVASSAVKFMPLGDSITLGWNYYPGTSYPSPGGYRTVLWQKLVQQDNANIDFVGSLSHGPSTLTDKNHEGHSGERIDQIRVNIDGYLSSASPDMILLMIGTNDVTQNYNLSTAPARLQDLVDRICIDRPTAHLMVSTIPPRPGRDSAVSAYNSAIPGIVTESQNKGCKTSFFDMFSAMTASDIATSDNTHPTMAGYDKMANAVYASVKALYDTIVAPTPTPMPTPTGTPVIAPAPVPTSTPAPTPVRAGDLNRDGRVNIFDLSIILRTWGTAEASGDLNGSGKVDSFDLSVVLSHWTD